jgi:hypothetical protein
MSLKHEPASAPFHISAKSFKICRASISCAGGVIGRSYLVSVTDGKLAKKGLVVSIEGPRGEKFI